MPPNRTILPAVSVDSTTCPFSFSLQTAINHLQETNPSSNAPAWTVRASAFLDSNTVPADQRPLPGEIRLFPASNRYQPEPCSIPFPWLIPDPGAPQAAAHNDILVVGQNGDPTITTLLEASGYSLPLQVISAPAFITTNDLPLWLERLQSAIRNVRYVVCLLPGTVPCLAMAMTMASARVPVIVGEGIALPFEKVVDYSSFSIHLGTSLAELELLHSMIRMPVLEAESLAQSARSNWLEHFTPVAVANHLLAQVASIANHPPSAIRRPGTSTAIPETQSLPPISPLDEPVLFRLVWQKLGDLCPPDSNRPLLIYGAGKFLQRFLPAIAESRGGPQLLGIADDGATPNLTIAGHRVRRPLEFDPKRVGAVLLATDSVADLLRARCRERFGDDIPIVTPAELATRIMHTPTSPKFTPPPRPTSRSRSTTPRLRKLEGVMVCVGYADYLSWTLPLNIGHFDRLVVVTDPADQETIRVARHCGATLVTSKDYRDKGASFNKGRMINAGIEALDRDNWLLFMDADIILPLGLRDRLNNRLLHPDCLYYVTRLEAPEKGLEDWLSHCDASPESMATLPFENPGANRMPWGYFQLVNARSNYLRQRKNGLYPDHCPSAGEVDVVFMNRWPTRRRVHLAEQVVHIPHGSTGINWKGRASHRISMRHTRAADKLPVHQSAA